MRTVLILIFTCTLLGGSPCAAILAGNRFSIDFTDPNQARTRAQWAADDKVALNEEGLGWDGLQNASRDFWIETMPIAVGLWWRPIQSGNITIEIEPDIKPFTAAGKSHLPSGGIVFVRHSPDAVHWSDWQVMQHKVAASGNQPKRHYTGQVQVTRRGRAQYEEYLQTYMKMDVPWASDAEALAKWILEQEPKFFEKHKPFIGYVQFLYECSLCAGQRISRFDANIGWAVSGLHVPPKDKSIETNSAAPWRFKTRPVEVWQDPLP